VKRGGEIKDEAVHPLQHTGLHHRFSRGENPVLAQPGINEAVVAAEVAAGDAGRCKGFMAAVTVVRVLVGVHQLDGRHDLAALVSMEGIDLVGPLQFLAQRVVMERAC
jgi:hypothetical protein